MIYSPHQHFLCFPSKHLDKGTSLAKNAGDMNKSSEADCVAVFSFIGIPHHFSHKQHANLEYKLTHSYFSCLRKAIRKVIL